MVVVRGDHRAVGHVRYITVRTRSTSHRRAVARGVFLALAQTVSADEFADVQAQLSRTSRGCCREIRPSRSAAGVLLDRVADRAGRDLDAQVASGVVLMVASPEPPTINKRPYRTMRPPPPKARSGATATCEGRKRRRLRQP
jgi:hypothetical protein